MKHAIAMIVAVVAWAFSSVVANAQTAIQTIAFITTGGIVDVSQMEEANANTVIVPAYSIAMTATPAQTVQMKDATTCEASATLASSPGFPRLSVTYYFGNMIPEATRAQGVLNNAMFQITNIYLVAEQKAVCFDGDRGNGCQREWDISANTKDVPRVLAAIKYLYSSFCKAARRKSAF